MEKYVYFFGGGKADGNGTMKDVLGGKGSGLAEMTNAGLPVPPDLPLSRRRAGSISITRTRPPLKSSLKKMRRWLDWRPCWARNSAKSRIRCWFRSAPAPNFPCPE